MHEARIVVPGSANMDPAAVTGRLPVPGEKGGARCAFVGTVGTDASGDTLRAACGPPGSTTTGYAGRPGPSGIALIVVDRDGENKIVVAPGVNATLTALERPTAPPPSSANWPR